MAGTGEEEKKTTMSRLPWNTFSGFRCWTVKEPPWSIKFALNRSEVEGILPHSLLAWWLSTAALPLSPAADMHRNQGSKGREPQIIRPTEMFPDGIHTSCCRGNKAQPEICENKTAQQKSTKSTTWEKEGRKKVHSDFIQIWRNQEGVGGEKKKKVFSPWTDPFQDAGRYTHNVYQAI